MPKKNEITMKHLKRTSGTRSPRGRAWGAWAGLINAFDTEKHGPYRRARHEKTPRSWCQGRAERWKDEDRMGWKEEQWQIFPFTYVIWLVGRDCENTGQLFVSLDREILVITSINVKDGLLPVRVITLVRSWNISNKSLFWIISITGQNTCTFICIYLKIQKNTAYFIGYKVTRQALNT